MPELDRDTLFLQRIEIDDELPEDTYVGQLPLIEGIQDAGGLDFLVPVTIFVGENGVGKSTLIEGIAVRMGFNPEGGTKNFSFSTWESHSCLGEHLRVLKGWKRQRDGFFLRAESFYNVATNIEQLDAERTLGRKVINSYGGKSLHKQSHLPGTAGPFLHLHGRILSVWIFEPDIYREIFL